MRTFGLSIKSILLFIFMLSACSKEVIYNMTQPNSSANQQRVCSEVPRSQQEICNERAMSYEEYKKARKETLDK